MPTLESYTPSPLGEMKLGVVDATAEQILSFFGDDSSSSRLRVSAISVSGELVEIHRCNHIDIPMERTVILFDTVNEALDFYQAFLNCYPELLDALYPSQNPSV